MFWPTEMFTLGEWANPKKLWEELHPHQETPGTTPATILRETPGITALGEPPLEFQHQEHSSGSINKQSTGWRLLLSGMLGFILKLNLFLFQFFQDHFPCCGWYKQLLTCYSYRIFSLKANNQNPTETSLHKILQHKKVLAWPHLNVS